jgi:hypothetical protein
MYSWQDDYVKALLENEPVRLKHYIYETMAAIQQRRLSPIKVGSDEYLALERAEQALEILRKTLE